MPKLQPTHPAWDLVRAYIEGHGTSTAYASEALEAMPSETKAPLSVLVRFELQRLGLSYQRAANKILRASTGEHDPISSAGLYYLVADAKHYTAPAATLEDLARGFAWDLDWLRQVNGDDLTAGIENEARLLAQDLAGNAELAALVRIARRLPPERLLATRVFAEQLLTEQQPTRPAEPLPALGDGPLQDRTIRV